MRGQAVDLKRLGKRLRSARLAAALTQKDLAGDDFTPAYVSQVERGVVQPSLDALGRLAARLDRPLSWLFEDEDRHDLHLRARVCLLLGRRLVASGRLEDAEAYLQQAADACRRLQDRCLQAATLTALGDLALAGGRTLEAASSYTEAMEMADRAGAARQVAVCSYRLGQLYLAQGNPLLAVQYLKRARELLPPHDALEPQLLAALARSYELLGEKDLAVSFDGRALDACRRRSGWITEVQRLGDASISAWAANRHWEALEHAERAWHLSAYRGQLVAHARLLLDGAARAVDGESHGLADQLIEESLAISRVVDDPSGLAAGWLLQARLSLCRGQLERAMAQGSRAREMADREGDAAVLAEVHHLLGRVEMQRGDTKVAWHHWEVSADCYLRSGDEARTADILAELGELALKEGDRNQALRYFRQAARPRPG